MSKVYDTIESISKSIKSGITPLRSNASYWSDGVIPWLKTEQLGEFQIEETNEKISEKALKETGIKINPANTISVALYGEGKTRGNVSILKKPMATNQACCNIVIDDEVADYRYVYYWLKNNYHQLRNLSSGVRKNLSADEIKTFPFNYRELAEQSAIANILSTFDNKIKLNNRINTELETMAKTIYNYWFVQFDFPDEEGKPYKANGGEMEWNEELKREIPKDWEAKALNTVTNVSNDSVNPQDNLDIDFKHFSIPTLDATGTYGIEKGSEINSNKFTVLESDILVSKLNPWFSRVVYGEDASNTICSTEFVVWRSRNNCIKNYLFMIASDKSFISYCTKNATGTSNSHKRVNPTLMMEYLISYNESIAKIFGEKLNDILKLIFSNKKQNQELITLRNFLLPLLMNGQVKVK